VLNRRQWLTGAAAVLAGATGCSNLKFPSLTAQQEPPEPVEEGPRPFRIALMSDPHTEEGAGANGKLKAAVADFKPLRPDIWLVNGDIANGGQAAQTAAFKKVMAAVAKPEQLLVNTGNHDFYDKDATDAEEIRRFCEAFALKTPYSNHLGGGIHVVMLADEQYKTAAGAREWAWLSAAQLTWFEKVLGEHKDAFTVVCLHQPLQDTITWTWGGNDFAGCGQIKELQAILKKNPQIKIWLSGHTHMGAEIKGNVSGKGGVLYVGLGSTYYQFVPSDTPTEFGDFKKDLSASQSRMMEVWPDRVVIRARDHVAKAWMDDYEFTVKRG
jgi:3',5'-cyclic AMP phosphodiesterase CpdA